MLPHRPSTAAGNHEEGPHAVIKPTGIGGSACGQQQSENNLPNSRGPHRRKWAQCPGSDAFLDPRVRMREDLEK